MKWKVGTKIAAGFGLVLVIFVVVGFVSWRNLQRQIEDADWVAHTQKVVATLAQLQTALQDAETGERGFIITGDERYLEPYRTGIAALPELQRQLAELISDNPRQFWSLKGARRILGYEPRDSAPRE